MPLSDEGLAAARAAYVTQLREGNAGPTDAARAIVEAYLAATPAVLALAAPTMRLDGRISPFPKACAAMAVGDKIFAPAMVLQSIRGRFPTARAIMDNPKAQWRTSTQPDGRVLVERMPDGVRLLKDPKANAKAMEMASLAVGETMICKAIRSAQGPGMMATDTKVQARRILGNPRADWTVTTTSKGVRLTRLPDMGPPPWGDDVQAVLEAVGRRYRVSIRNMTGPSHKPKPSAARADAYRAIRTLERPPSLELIGEWFGGRSAPSVQQAMKRPRRVPGG